jgi:hypothetical protein
VKGHIQPKCRSKHKWAKYEKSKSDANLASTASISVAESESIMILVIHSDRNLESTADCADMVKCGIGKLICRLLDSGIGSD